MRSVRALVSIPSVICICLFILGGESQAARVIPLEYRDGLIWVKVRTSTSAAPLNFVLDSGAGASVLNLPTAHRLGVRLGLLRGRRAQERAPEEHDGLLAERGRREEARPQLRQGVRRGVRAAEHFFGASLRLFREFRQVNEAGRPCV